MAWAAVAICTLFTAVSFASGAWWAPRDTFNAPDSEVRHRLSILVNASGLTYSSTSGSYFNPKDANATIGEGWLRFAEENPEYGMRAIAFVHFDSSRVLIAYRGTDLDINGVSGQADACADVFLFAENQTLPSFCSKFNASVVDYASNARRFAFQIQQQLPGFDMFYTGHSLGAALAAMMPLFEFAQNNSCVAVSSGAVTFAAPDYVFAISKHTSLNLTEVAVDSFGGVDDARILVLAAEYDPIFYTANHRPAKGMIGHLCIWKDLDPPAACISCDQIQNLPNMTNDIMGIKVCRDCLMERHFFSYYAQLVHNGTRPECRPEYNCQLAPEACLPQRDTDICS